MFLISMIFIIVSSSFAGEWKKSSQLLCLNIIFSGIISSITLYLSWTDMKRCESVNQFGRHINLERLTQAGILKISCQEMKIQCQISNLPMKMFHWPLNICQDMI